MRGRTVILVAILTVAVAPPDAAQAQFLPRGIVGGITRPLRQMLRHFGHFPRHRYHHRASASMQRTPNPAPPSKTSSTIGSRLGWTGPATWPSAYEDVLGFAIAPESYAAQLRSHGFDVIANTIIGHFEVPRPLTQAETTGVAVRNDASNDRPADACTDLSSVQDNWPATQIEQTAKLSDTQHHALNQLQAAVTRSIKGIKAGCHDLRALKTRQRLNILVQTLWSVRDAEIAARAPFKRFYGALTQTQQNTFVREQPNAQPDSKAKTAKASANRQYQACAAQNLEPAERMIKVIEQRARPNKGQAASLEKLHNTSSDMAKLLMASCAKPIPAGPVARLDVADSHLTAMNYAATTVQIAFNNFYATLDDSQKAMLDNLGR